MPALPGPVGAAGLDLQWLMQVFEGYGFTVQQLQPDFFAARRSQTTCRIGLDRDEQVVRLTQAWRLNRQKPAADVRRAVREADDQASINRFFIWEEDWNLIVEARFPIAGKVVRADDVKEFVDRADGEFTALSFSSGLYTMFA